MSAGGRPTAWSLGVQASIVEALREGLYRVTAAQLAGICERTLYNWIERGEAGEEPYCAFLQACKRAEAEAEHDIIATVRRGAEGWQSKAWIAERRWPKRWAGRVRVAVTEEIGVFTERLRRNLDEPTYRKVLDASREDAPAAGDSRH